MTATATPRTDTRTPLDVGHALADRFMRTPRQDHYMWDVGLGNILDMYVASRQPRYLEFYLRHTGADKPRYDFHLYQATGDTRFLAGAREKADAFLANPHRDREGCMLDPRGRYTIDCLSGLFTAPLVFGHVLKDPVLFDDALRHYEIHRDYLEDPLTGLWSSRWGHSLHPNRPNPGLWSRGNGWLVAAWGRVAHLWDPAHPAYDHILAEWQRYCRTIAGFQTGAGTFRQILNRPTSFHEASGTALFCTGFSYGVIHGSLPEGFAPIAWKAFCGLRGLVDDRGNIHNGSTFAGGYNYEWQYETCPFFNEPHATATAIGACAAMHQVLEARPGTDTTPPRDRPVVITVEVPGVLMTEPVTARPAPEIAAPVLARLMALNEWPENDLTGATIHGLLAWYDQARNLDHLNRASALLELAKPKLPAPAWWNAAAAVAARLGQPGLGPDLATAVDAELGAMARDRNGLWLDSQGGYSVERLYYWLPLLGRATTLTGQRRYLDEAFKQLIGHASWLEDPSTRLWYSAFGHGQRRRYCSPGFWAMGNALLMCGIVDLLEHTPRDHPHFVDAVYFLRRLLEAAHTYFPVSLGWKQLMDRLDFFACTSATGLFTIASAKAILNKWDHPAYYAMTWGGVYHLGALVDAEGNTQWSSKPTGGLDSIEAWREHRTMNDPAALGNVLGACALMMVCDRVDINRGSNDGTRGAR